jgi:hypothetical protein
MHQTTLENLPDTPSATAIGTANRERRERGTSTGPTGPRTEAGKLRSSINGLRHGLRAMKTENAVPDEMRKNYEKLRAQYLAEYRPAGPTESTLLDMVILAAWQLYRIREMELFAPIELASPLDTSSFGRSDRLARYRAGYERMFKTNLNQLKQIQQERLLLAADREACLPTHIPPGVRLKPLFDLLDNVAWRSSARLATYAAAAGPQKPAPTPRYNQENSPSIRP